MLRPALLCVLFFTACATPPPALPPSAWPEVWPDFPTVAESSQWRATATHAQVMASCRALAAASPRINMLEAGRTAEGRALPILVIADPPVHDPREVGDRLVVFAWAGIHSGEVCGKPACLMLAREWGAPGRQPLLNDLVVVLMPLLNADGNDRMDPGNRPGQKGPVEGMGTRPNAAGLNINRDFTKLDTREARAVVGVMRDWQPALAMDLHTTNGSKHRYVLTYDGQRHPDNDLPLRLMCRQGLLPEVSARMERDSERHTFFYGNFSNQNQDWSAYPAMLRYSTHYGGMRPMLSVLSEAYSYAPYQERVLATKEFVRDCFAWVADSADAVRDEIAAAHLRAATRPGVHRIALTQESFFGEERVTVLGYEGGGSHSNPSEVPKEYQLRYNGHARATNEVVLPWAYALPASATNVLDNLAAHGIKTRVLDQPLTVTVEIYTVDQAMQRERRYEGHQMQQVRVTTRTERRELPAATVIVPCNQVLGTLAAYLLEPEAEDGLCAWNFYDNFLEVGADLPILRIVEEIN